MKVHMDRVIRHLKAQINAAKRIDSDWVYITLPQAEKCLELAEKEYEREHEKHDDKTVR